MNKKVIFEKNVTRALSTLTDSIATMLTSTLTNCQFCTKQWDTDKILKYINKKVEGRRHVK